MIKVQQKVCEFSNSIVNDVATRYLHVVNDDSNPECADRYWIMTNSGTQVFTYGTKHPDFNSAAQPTLVNGIPVEPQIRTGQLTYHGPGQLSWVAVLDYRRLRRLQGQGNHFDINRLLECVKDAVNTEFNETLQYDPADPGFYRPTGEKVLSYGVDLPGMRWIAIKISLNLCVDLSVYNNTAICGVENRVMDNIMTTLPDQATQIALAQSVAQRFWDNVYLDGYQLDPWTD